VPQLPFELAALPHRLLKWLRLPVVSYALPALIAIGQARHHKCPTRNPVAWVLRWLTRRGTLRKLSNIQPEGGGFLEAAPLTSFVVMSLAAIGKAGSDVVSRGVTFLAESVRDDGSWPIDTNLATWVTTLSVNALAANPDFHEALPDAARGKVREWLLGQQYRREHPYTHADPGGWAWTDCPGGVPDADDTAGALLALRGLGPMGARTSEAAKAGVVWLADLQNRDGGMPTFCRSWGTLPFDRSGADLTAHALLAIAQWLDDLPPALSRRARGAIERGLEYLRNSQRSDGSWVPLWFGNQSAPGLENPTYGTARVVAALAELAARGFAAAAEMSAKGAAWLVSAQNSGGGWGGAPSVASSIEETAIAVDALARFRAGQGDGSSPASDLPPSAGDLDAAISRGASWLVEHTERGKRWHPSPIGFYFA
ncbi:MAG: prenyltransferase/squalene oxidase repeat-containing protein, partial [Phycisphaerae bacterium]|nr:prenyltransferase/squalene oxidase repeat-containing protein [Phycisphaerae bacterium]